MPESHAQIRLSEEIQEDLEASNIYLQDEVLKARKELTIIHVGEEGQRDAATIIAGSATIITALTPVLIEIVKRLLPHKKTEVELSVQKDGRHVYTIKTISEES